MTKLTEAQKTAQAKYDEKFPKVFFRIDRETYDRLKKYSDAVDIPIKDIIKESIIEYLDRKGSKIKRLFGLK
jgi:hypothetical protein